MDHVSFWYGDRPALNDVTMAIDRQVITALSDLQAAERRHCSGWSTA